MKEIYENGFFFQFSRSLVLFISISLAHPFTLSFSLSSILSPPPLKSGSFDYIRTISFSTNIKQQYEKVQQKYEN